MIEIELEEHPECYYYLIHFRVAKRSEMKGYKLLFRASWIQKSKDIN